MIIIIKIKFPFGDTYDVLLYKYRDIIGMYYDASNRTITIPVPIDSSILEIIRMILNIAQVNEMEIHTLGGMDPYSFDTLDPCDILHIVVSCASQKYLKCGSVTLNLGA